MIQYFQTRRISDMTEGRGHMVNDRAFTEWQYAADYINSQPGVMGRRVKWTEEKYAGDWDIQTINVYDAPFDPEAEARANALAKLTPQERKLLGLE
ncbi:hypothetical protein SEPL_466 [Salmonella phage SE_PL]|nr:hypothetical protein 7t3_088 [Salmonella phage 7t3]QIG63079.1 hypothetical protein SEPL_466 [Salmonella phage SE_PL]